MKGISPALRGPAGRRRYKAYMNSPAWWRRRQTWWDTETRRLGEAPSCAGCRTKFTLATADLHHHTYERLGAERHQDLVALCRSCHEFVHEVIGFKSMRRVSRTAATITAVRALRARTATQERRQP